MLPLAHPPISAPPEIPAGRTVVSLGWLAANKAPELAIDVLSRLDETATLTFVGPAAGDTADRVRGVARAVGVADRVEFTGRLDDVEYAALVSHARVGLQLRTSDRGEMSAAVTDLLAHGIPTVTTLQTSGRTSAGLQIVEPDPELLAAAVTSLFDDAAWSTASIDARDRAAGWTFADVADALLDWIRDVDALEPSTIRRR